MEVEGGEEGGERAAARVEGGAAGEDVTPRPREARKEGREVSRLADAMDDS